MGSLGELKEYILDYIFIVFFLIIFTISLCLIWQDFLLIVSGNQKNIVFIDLNFFTWKITTLDSNHVMLDPEWKLVGVQISSKWFICMLLVFTIFIIGSTYSWRCTAWFITITGIQSTKLKMCFDMWHFNCWNTVMIYWVT